MKSVGGMSIRKLKSPEKIQTLGKFSGHKDSTYKTTMEPSLIYGRKRWSTREKEFRDKGPSINYVRVSRGGEGLEKSLHTLT